RVGLNVVVKVQPLALAAQGTISGTTISGNNAGHANCDDYDGVEVYSSVLMNGDASHVSSNNGNGIDVHDGASFATGGSGITVASNGADGVLIEGTGGAATLGAADSVTGNCAATGFALSGQGALAGIASFGFLTATGTTVSGNACDGIYIDSG